MAIYILSPGNLQTGGPEAMHQLSDALIRLGHETYMVYFDLTRPQDMLSDGVLHVHRPPQLTSRDRYRDYLIEEAVSVPDRDGNILIVPEIYLHFAKAVTHCKVFVWWLSVDNAFKARTGLPAVGGMEFFRENPQIGHLAQSFYAELFLYKNRVRTVHRLFDYISKSYYPQHVGFDRAPTILYNPRKGLDLALQFKDQLAEPAAMVAIENMSNAQVRQALARAMLFIDFGDHPGKDRLPREAACCGAVAFVRRQGAALHTADVPLPEAFRFADDEITDGRLKRKVEACFAAFPAHCDALSDYRRRISLEYQEFVLQTRQVFGPKEPFGPAR